MSLHEALTGRSEEHCLALSWFQERTGENIAWPEPLAGLFLMNKAKGIHKPAGWAHALSVRQSLGSPYADGEVAELPDGDWTYDYFQEGYDPGSRDTDFTNRAMMRNIKDGVPVAVIRQISVKPASRYRILGLASVSGWRGGYFLLRRYVPAA